MKKWILIALIFCGLTSFRSVEINMNEVRAMYEEAYNNGKTCEKFIEISSSFDEKNNPLMLGYKGCATMLMAKHVFNPFSKMAYFKKGKQMLEKAIAADETNIELRFLRFTAQSNMPTFLGYSDSIEKDKNFIIEFFYQIKDEKLKKFMLPALNESKYLNYKEKQQLQ